MIGSTVQVIIYPFGSSTPVDVSHGVVSGNIARPMGREGVFGLALLSYGVPLLDSVQVGDWIQIRMESPTGVMSVKLWGRIDTLTDNTTATQAGGSQYTLQIGGRDHSSVFTDIDLTFNPYVALRFQTTMGIDVPWIPTSSIVYDTRFVDLIDGRPDEFFRYVYNKFLTGGPTAGQYMLLPQCLQNDLATRGFTNPAKASDLIKLNVGPIADSVVSPGLKGLLFDFSIIGGMWGNSLLTLLNKYSNPAFNEFFFRVYGPTGIPEAVIRERPFPMYSFGDFIPGSGFVPDLTIDRVMVDASAWNAVEGVIISESSVVKSDLNRSSTERFNLWSLVPAESGLSEVAVAALLSEDMFGSLPVMDLESIMKYGLKRMIPQTMYSGITGDSKSSGPWVKLYAAWIAQLYAWNKLNPLYRSGTITVNGFIDTDVGTRLWITRKDSTVDEFYVENVQWAWAVSENGARQAQTSFAVTRGLKNARGTFSRKGSAWVFAWDEYPLGRISYDAFLALKGAVTSEFSFTDSAKLSSESSVPNYPSESELNASVEEYQFTFEDEEVQQPVVVSHRHRSHHAEEPHSYIPTEEAD